MAEGRSPNMKLGGFSSSLRDQNQTVHESCQEPLPGPVNWVSGDQLAKRGKSICKLEEHLCEDRFPSKAGKWDGPATQILTSGRLEFKKKKKRENKRKKHKWKGQTVCLRLRQTLTKRNKNPFIFRSGTFFFFEKRSDSSEKYNGTIYQRFLGDISNVSLHVYMTVMHNCP